MTGAGKHLLRVSLWDGSFARTVDCPHEEMGAKRPCAVWANDDGSEREDECTFQQYLDAADLDEWLLGGFDFEPVPIEAAGSGDDWHAVVAK